MPLIEKTTNGIIFGDKLFRYLMSVPSNDRLNIFTDIYNFNMLKNIQHKNASFNLFVRGNGVVNEFDHVRNLNSRGHRMTVHIDSDSTDTMTEYIKHHLENYSDEYIIIVSSSSRIEEMIERCNLKNVFHIRHPDTKSFCREDMWRIFRC